MRGKKIDTQFVSDFITNCVQNGYDTPDTIVAQANKRITEIDDAIKKIELQKIERSKLLDVVNSFEKPHTSKLSEAKILSFFNLQYPDICKYICKELQFGPITIEHISVNHVHTNVIFCVKQLIEQKIISKSGNYLLRGNQFDAYLKFVLKESA